MCIKKDVAVPFVQLGETEDGSEEEEENIVQSFVHGGRE